MQEEINYKLLFIKLAESKGYKILKPKYQQKQNNIDFILEGQNQGQATSVTVDLKKKNSKNANSWVYVEFESSKGEKGWIYGSCDFIVFETTIVINDSQNTFDSFQWFSDAALTIPVGINDVVNNTCDPSVVTLYVGLICSIDPTPIFAGTLNVTIYPAFNPAFARGMVLVMVRVQRAVQVILAD